MTTALVSKMTVLKAGTTKVVNPDGVVVLNPGSSASYLIDTTTPDKKAVQFSNMAVGADVSYTALYALAKAAFPTEFP